MVLRQGLGGLRIGDAGHRVQHLGCRVLRFGFLFRGCRVKGFKALEIYSLRFLG